MSQRRPPAESQEPDVFAVPGQMWGTVHLGKAGGVVVRRSSSGVMDLGFECRLHHSPALWPWAGPLASVSSSVKWAKTPPTSEVVAGVTAG